MKKECGTCTYYYEAFSSDEGVCRRYPPKVEINPQLPEGVLKDAEIEPYRNTTLSFWPEVYVENFCGEYEQATEII